MTIKDLRQVMSGEIRIKLYDHNVRPMDEFLLREADASVTGLEIEFIAPFEVNMSEQVFVVQLKGEDHEKEIHEERPREVIVGGKSGIVGIVADLFYRCRQSARVSRCRRRALTRRDMRLLASL